MLRLLLLRHAKSSWDESGLPDKERPLSPRGRQAAVTMAEAIEKEGLLPDRILCSPARRTRETLAALVPHLGGEARIALTEELYAPASGDYLPTIASQGDDAGTLLIIGHNPAIQATAIRLIGGGDTTLQISVAAKFPTGALAIITFDHGPWSEIAPYSGTLAAFITPRERDHDGPMPGAEK